MRGRRVEVAAVAAEFLGEEEAVLMLALSVVSLLLPDLVFVLPPLLLLLLLLLALVVLLALPLLLLHCWLHLLLRDLGELGYLGEPGLQVPSSRHFHPFHHHPNHLLQQNKST
jgi:hypothetical protein